MIFFHSAIGFGLMNHTSLDAANHLQKLVVKEFVSPSCHQLIQEGYGPWWFFFKEAVTLENLRQKSICLPAGTEENVASGDSGGPLLLQVSRSI